MVRPTDRFNMIIAVDRDVFKKLTHIKLNGHLKVLPELSKILTSHSHYLIMYLY